MSARGDLEATLARLAVVRADPLSPAAADELRRALGNRSNLIVARAAEIVGEWELPGYVPELVTAFDWFMGSESASAIRRDHTCAAKLALAEALVALDYDGGLFERGIAHVQPEPVWGGTEDTAARLRAVCALGLARANPPDVLLRLATLLADQEADARAGAAYAIARVARPGAAALLWYKTLVGDDHILPLQACFAGLLALEPVAAVLHIGGFLHSPIVAVAEAAASELGASRLPAAGPLLREAWDLTREPTLRRPLLAAVAHLRDEEGFAFLLNLLLQGQERDARDALAALAVYRDDARHWRKVERALLRRPELAPRGIDAS